MDGVMNARTTSVSNSSPRPMVVPIDRGPANRGARTDLSGGEHQAGPSGHRRRCGHRTVVPVFKPAPSPRLNREISSRVIVDPGQGGQREHDQQLDAEKMLPPARTGKEAPNDSAAVP